MKIHGIMDLGNLIWNILQIDRIEITQSCKCVVVHLILTWWKNTKSVCFMSETMSNAS